MDKEDKIIQPLVEEKVDGENLLPIERASILFDEVIHKVYLANLSTAEIIPYTGEKESIRWYHITKIVYEKGVFFTDKMAMLYASLHNICSVVAMALKKRNGKLELYLGTRDEIGENFVSGKILDAGMKGVLPGIEFKNSAEKDMLEGFQEENASIACVSGVASLTDDKKENFIQGIENLINATKQINKFTALVIAYRVSKGEALNVKRTYENLYSAITPFAQVQITFNESTSNSVATSVTEGFNYTVSEDVAKQGTCDTRSRKERMDGTKQEIDEKSELSILHPKTWDWKSCEALNKWGVDWNLVIIAKHQSKHHDETKTRNKTKTIGHTYQITQQNRYVKSCMNIIDRQIERIQKSVPSGLWSVATYFIAGDDTTSQELAGIYRGVIVGDKSEVEATSINLWSCKNKDTTNEILKYLKNQLHPQFRYKENFICTAGSLVDSRELAIHLSLPQSSVPGLLVREEKSFGRDVKAQEDLTDENSINIGNVLHLGEMYPEEVRLGINGLSKHTFVTGTTGSGKSNTLYLLIDELIQKKKKFLVIEPAKGEYKEVFGSDMDVTVYSTNPRMGKLLTINPFVFPEDIDVYEHIDSLVEIFNACWPMYAAMPQVLKHSIMEAYKSCGWDLSRSQNTKGIYPIVEDVLDALKEYINSSEYSSDTKGDYKGSLETRLHSLCEGLVGRMFSGKPIADEEIFNQNAIIDLSRVKSSETKSLLMGLLIMKLNEYRVSEHKGMNRELHHVTIIEEAHNLLKRTSTAQTADSSNIAGMAVEKIANSMAEMRTYGEGFIIVDQSPSLLDLATIRNTNTKIIMALPEKDDRDIAGKAVCLNDGQIPEISRLKTGEAIVYQNGWEEPVKSRIRIYRQNAKYLIGSQEFDNTETGGQGADMTLFFDTLYYLYCYTDFLYKKEDFESIIINTLLSGRKKVLLLDIINSTEIPSVDDCATMMAIVIGTELCQKLQNVTDLVSMNKVLYKELQQHEGLYDNGHLETFANMYIRGCSLKATKPFYDEWQEQTIKSQLI